jgi:hypothetical protein
MTPVHILLEMTLTYQTGFYINSSFLSNCTNDPIYSSLYIREEKYRDIVFREIIHTMKTKPIFPKGVFCSVVYNTRENTYKDCYIRQERSQQGAFRTSTIFDGRGEAIL